MLCPSCGNQIPDTTSICPNCGTSVAGDQVAQQPPFQQTEQTVADIPGTPLQSNYRFSYNKDVVQYAESHGIKMKWYKALTVALLYISAAINFLSAYSDLYSGFTGFVRAGEGGGYFVASTTTRVLLLMHGIYGIGLGSATLRARKQLARFEFGGPQFYLNILIVNMVVTFALRLLESVLWGGLNLVSLANAGVRFVIPIALFILNKIYFDKRKHLFTA